MFYVLRILPFVLLAHGSTVWVPEDREPRIVGGLDALPGAFPYQVSLRTALGQHFCGGSIIGDKDILTAAHCIAGMSAGDVKVLMGTNTQNSGGSSYDTANITCHEKFNRTTLENDICLVKLSKKIEYSDKIKNISLCEKEASAGDPCVITGWGYTSYPNRPMVPNKLQYLNTTVISFEKCKDGLKKTRPHSQYLTKNMHVCAFHSRRHGACLGDSGGPLVTSFEGKWTQQGITSYVIPCAVASYPDVYINVCKYLQWIIDHTN